VSGEELAGPSTQKELSMNELVWDKDEYKFTLYYVKYMVKRNAESGEWEVFGLAPSGEWDWVYSAPGETPMAAVKGYIAEIGMTEDMYLP
jgi:hypothetical protein